MSQIEINNNLNSVNVENTINTVDVDNSNGNVVIVPQEIVKIIEINTPGPQGSPGDPTVLTGSFVSTSSFNAFTSSYNTGSFTGSFIGSLEGTASFASTASFATTASYALNTNIFLRNETNASTTDIITINQSIFNPSNLTVLSSSIFIVEAEADYYVLGDLINSGSIIVDGTLKIGGTLYNAGTITGTGIIE